MSPLALLLIFKIVVTVIAVSVPLLFLPKAKLDTFAGFGTPNTKMYRLYGLAVTALLVGYGAGLVAVMDNRSPTGILLMGLLSNAGAAALILGMPPKGSKVMGAVFATIAVGLIAALAWPHLAIQPLW